MYIHTTNSQLTMRYIPGGEQCVKDNLGLSISYHVEVKRVAAEEEEGLKKGDHRTGGVVSSTNNGNVKYFTLSDPNFLYQKVLHEFQSQCDKTFLCLYKYTLSIHLWGQLKGIIKIVKLQKDV